MRRTIYLLTQKTKHTLPPSLTFADDHAPVRGGPGRVLCWRQRAHENNTCKKIQHKWKDDFYTGSRNVSHSQKPSWLYSTILYYAEGHNNQPVSNPGFKRLPDPCHCLHKLPNATAFSHADQFQTQVGWNLSSAVDFNSKYAENNGPQPFLHCPHHNKIMKTQRDCQCNIIQANLLKLIELRCS